MTEKQPGVEFVAEQAAPLGKIDAGAVAQAVADAQPDAIFNVTFGADLQKFVREGETRGLFKDRPVFSVLGGEPEYLDPLKDEAPVGWYVTGYPWQSIETPEHKAFVEAYRKKFNDYPRLGSDRRLRDHPLDRRRAQEGRVCRDRKAHSGHGRPASRNAVRQHRVSRRSTTNRPWAPTLGARRSRMARA